MNSDFASRATDRRSVSGGVVMCAGARVSFFSRTQKSVTSPSTEAEYVAMAEGFKEAIFLWCVFSSHSFWTSSSLDVPAGVTQEEGHTGFLIHLLSAVRALIFLARRIQPFLSLVDREVDCFCTSGVLSFRIAT